MRFLEFTAVVLLANWVTSTSIDVQQSLQDKQPISKDSLIKLHKALVEQPSITGSEGNVSPLLINYLKSRGFTVKAQHVAGSRENVFAYIGKSPKARILVTSHIDTVPPFWPYERRGEEIWGRGTVDAKGSVAAQIIAVESLLETSQVKEGDVTLLYVVGEEKGGAGMRAANDLGLYWETVIFGEPTELKLASGHKGGLGFTVKAKGKAGHSGYPELGKNANNILVKALAALDGIQLPWSEKYGNTTINLGRLEGGVAANVIAEDAFAIFSVRIATEDLDSIKELVEQTVKKASPEVEIEFTYGIGPVPVDHDIKGEYSRVKTLRMNPTDDWVGFETVVVNYGTDIPALKGDHKRYLYGPGSILVAHSDHEHVTISDLEAAVQGYKILITESLKQAR
jgi:acetylornithine deacetylase